MRKKTKMAKKAIAAKVSNEVGQGIDKIVKESAFLGLSKSQVVAEILEMYFKADHLHGDKVRGRVIEKKKRNGG